MARSTNETNETPTNTVIDYNNLPDNMLYMSVDGYTGFLPMLNIETLSPAQNVAINEGRKQIALRKAQTVVKKAKADGADVRQRLQAFLSAFEPNTETEFQTVAGKRREIAAGILKELLSAAGKPNDDATVDHHVAAFMGMEKHQPRINAALANWAQAYVPPTKRGAGNKTPSELDLDSLDSL